MIQNTTKYCTERNRPGAMYTNSSMEKWRLLTSGWVCKRHSADAGKFHSNDYYRQVWVDLVVDNRSPHNSFSCRDRPDEINRSEAAYSCKNNFQVLWIMDLSFFSGYSKQNKTKQKTKNKQTKNKKQQQKKTEALKAPQPPCFSP